MTGNQLVDAQGLPFLIRGTQTTPFHLKTAAFDARSGREFGPQSATSFSAIRLRFNMNAVHIAADVSDSDQDGYFDQLKQLVTLANQYDLLVILAASEPAAQLPSARLLAFWDRCAVVFKDFPNVLFGAFDGPSPPGSLSAGGGAHSKTGWDLWQDGGKLPNGTIAFGMQDVIRTIRSRGARQPVVLTSWNDSTLFQGYDPARFSKETDILYEVSPRYEDARTDSNRDAQFGFLTGVAPLIANDWDLHLDEPKACQALPSGPDAVSKLVLDNMAYFEKHNMAWTVSTYGQGRLLQDTVSLFPTMLEAGVKCGASAAGPVGIGRLVLSHMFGTDEGKLVVVNISGGLILPRGGYSTIYGRIMADRDSKAPKPPPYRLGGLSVEITDSSNVSRAARINWASAGWGSLNFVVPAGSAPGHGRLTILREDGTRDIAEIQIADAAPGLYTGLNCQGPAVGVFSQTTASGRVMASSAISTCKDGTCDTVAIPVAPKTITRVRLVANGFRNATSASQIEVTIAGVRVPVLSFKPANDAGVDELIISIPESLRGTGETDLICHVNGILSNAVRISIAGDPHLS